MAKTPAEKNSKGPIAKIRRRIYQAKITLMVVGILVFGNFALQLIRKPTELLSFLGLSSKKTPRSTWYTYGEDFLKNATPIVTADFLAAIAQVESAGDPVAQPAWTMNLSREFFRWYSPASSAVGLMQITEGNYQEAKNLCIRGGQVVRAGLWYEADSCWFNSLYSRILPSHSIEMAAAYMHFQVEAILKKLKKSEVAIEEKQRLAAIIHLCGKVRGFTYASDNFSFRRFQTCGSHDARSYLAKVLRYKSLFLGLMLGAGSLR
ncbi:MAG: transglycosylase SLT domain-containing protein [Pseudomonadota bacterium]|nr:transglycosylase SLT domain-containing protein [Pseudomonadota bacterium]